MRFLKTYLPFLILLLSLASISLTGCQSGTSSNQAALNQIVTARRGDLKIEITATGNLALSQTADLAFEFGSASAPAIVDKVLVEEGDSVKQGQLLAELDASDWEEQKGSLERAVIQAKISLKNAQLALENAKNTTNTNVYTGTAVAPDPLDIEIKTLQVELAKANLDNAQKQLDKWLETSPQVIAPFDGFVTSVNVKGGDEVKKGTIAVSVADPNKFEANVLVNEMDITKIQVGTSAIARVTSLSGLTLPAKVVSIAPTATIQGGVVNYEVRVEVLPFQDTKSPESVQPNQLREGLTADISIVIEEKKDVILVPSRAIISQGKETLVQVLKNEVTELRSVKVGSSNFQFTEITEGLDEGEQVVMSSSSTQSTTTSGGPQGPPPGMFIR